MWNIYKKLSKMTEMQILRSVVKLKRVDGFHSEAGAQLRWVEEKRCSKEV